MEPDMASLKIVAATKFKIEKGITHSKSKLSFPFGEMAVGDSFHADANVFTRLASAASWYGKRHDKKFSVRRDGDGHRCWRVT